MHAVTTLSCPTSLVTIALAGALATLACSSSDANSGPGGSGGEQAIGGRESTGGQSSTSNASATGGAQQVGGSATSGTTMAQGGSASVPTGGAPASGGSSSSTQPKNTGGLAATGGKAGVGGTTSTTGTTNTTPTNTGGSAGTGGSASSATGGMQTTGGTTGTAGSSGAGGSTDATCHPKFASGVNIAWFRFASDVPLQGNDISKYTTLFQNVKNSGGSAVRWWFHTNGTTTPGYDSTGKAKPISDSNIADLKKILDAAHAQGVGLVISLWSFGMLDSGQTSDSTLRGYNKALLENDTNRQAYIDNVLTKMVTALKGYPGLFAWEIFNEPEGMSSDDGGWTNPSSERTKTVNLQKTVNWLTSAIKNADPSALVTSSANNFATLSPSHGKNLWSDVALTAAGGKSNGVLDFYEVHYYNTWNGADAYSPFLHPSTYWGLDKNVVIGEFWTDTTDGVAAADLYTNLYTSSYAGAWAWQYANADNPPPSSGASTIWPAMKTPMDKLFSAHAADLTCQ